MDACSHVSYFSATVLFVNNPSRIVKGFATRSENSNEIVSMTSYLRQTIVTIAFVNDFVQGGGVELYRFIALYHRILIG